MNRESIILVTLVAYKIILIGIGFWASKRTNTSEDFFIGGKTLGPWVAAISSSASASSAWSLLGVSGAAYVMGYSALWLFPAVVGGYIFNWLWLAPRLNRLGNKTGAVTLTELLSGNDAWTRRIVYLATFAIVFSFSFYVAAQFQAAGATFASSFNMNAEKAIILGTLIILFYTLLGGFWAVSVTDTLQGILMALTAILLPVAALIQIGGFEALHIGLNQAFNVEQLSLTGAHSGWLAFAFVLGMLGIGLGNPGQPHVVNRFMALRDEKALKDGAVIGIIWPIIVYSGMLILGFCARVLLPGAENNEQVLFGMTEFLFHPIIAGVIVAAVLSAIMSTADSQLLVASSSLSYDLPTKPSKNQTRGQENFCADGEVEPSSNRKQLILARLSVVVMCAIAMLIALYAPQAIFSRVLFAWAAIGSAFAPVLIVLLCGYQIKGAYRFGAMFIGFTLTVVFNWQENTPGDVIERVVPFALALVIAFLGRKTNLEGANLEGANSEYTNSEDTTAERNTLKSAGDE